MFKRLLLPTQKNKVFEAIQTIGLSPEDFDWREDKSHHLANHAVSTVFRKHSEYYFCFDAAERADGISQYFGYSPGNSSFVERGWTSTPDFIFNVKEWLKNLQRETEAPDLWRALAEESAMIQGMPGTESANTLFTPEEQQKVKAALNEIKAYMCQLQKFSLEQQQVIEANFNYLIDATNRVGRKDWKVIFLGTLISTAIALAIPADNTSAILRFAAQIIRKMLSEIIYLPLPH